MGSFSFTRADHTTKRANIACGDKYKFLIPQEFGGGFVMDIYDDYGRMIYNEKFVDMYGILAWWNGCEGLQYEGDTAPKTMQEICERGMTDLQENRCKGFGLHYGDEGHTWNMEKLKYPLKLVSVSYKGTYEDCKGISFSDGKQGWNKGFWDESCYKKVLERLIELEGGAG